jgi:hypothetical protein
MCSVNARYPRRFFEINVLFALKIAEVSDQALEGALFNYTVLYRRFGLGQDRNPAHPTWQAYLNGLRRAPDLTDWTYQFYLAQPQADVPSGQPDFGCFSYDVWPDNRIRLHFHNAELPEYSPLSRQRLDARLSELRAMFGHLKRTVPSPATVIGCSWLYNIEAYRRLFPPAFLATAQVSYADFPFLVLWGQFLDRNWQIKEDLAGRFLDCLGRARDLEAAKRCFPYPVLRLECPVQPFYDFYGI